MSNQKHNKTLPIPDEMKGPSRHYRVVRDGALDLYFTGWLLGEGHHGTGGTSGYSCDWHRGIDVTIHVTTGGRLVTAAKRWSRWQGEGEHFTAAAHDSAEEALLWLQKDALSGELGPASKQAWEQAAKTWRLLAVYAVEKVH